MPDKAPKLEVHLGLGWKHGNEYEATVTVTTTDTCYHEGDLKIGLPPGMKGIPEVEYLTFSFTHDEGKKCGQLTKKNTKKIVIPFSSGKRDVTAYAAVNGKEAGHDTKPFPK